MINGQRAEAQKGFTVLEDFDEGTFERFIERIHIRYCTAAGLKMKVGGSACVCVVMRAEKSPKDLVRSKGL